MGLTAGASGSQKCVENRHDYYADWVAAGCPRPPDPDYTIWRQNRYATVDDNGDPNTINWDGFHFTELDWNVENIIIPLKQQVEANGENLFITLNYVAFTGQIVGGSYHHDDPAEYAEFVLPRTCICRTTMDWCPIHGNWCSGQTTCRNGTGPFLGEAIVGAAPRLAATGFTPAFVGPSNTNMANAITYFDDMIALPGALDHIEEVHLWANLSRAECSWADAYYNKKRAEGQSHA